MTLRPCRPVQAVVICLTTLAFQHCLAFAVADESTDSYSCDEIESIPKIARCQFVQSSCESESRVPYNLWYYCSVEPAGGAAKTFFVAALLLVLPLLFCLLGDTAEMYFSPIMSHISQTIPKMRPRFAGVTFVALGNGAPDLSSNISAIQNGQITLAAGALTGSAMFVQCIVASEVVRIAGGARCQGALLRDLGIYFLAITAVLAFFAAGIINQGFVALALLLYIAFVAWVFLGDEWHAAGRPKFQLSRSMQFLRETFSGRVKSGSQMIDEFEEGLLPWAAVEGEAAPGGEARPLQPLQSQVAAGHEPGAAATFALLPARQYQRQVWADLGEPEDAEPSPLRMHSRDGSGSRGYEPPSAQYQELSGTHTPDSADEPVQNFGGPRSPPVAATAAATAPGGVEGRPAAEQLWLSLKSDLTMGGSEEWAEAGPFVKNFRAVTFTLLFPVYLAQRMTIPFVDPSAYNPQWLVVAMLCAPLAVLVYFGASSMLAVLLAMAIGAALATGVWYLTSGTTELPPVMLGSFAAAPAVLALAGFFMGVLWIDTIASEVVGLLSFLAGLAGIPAGVLGLTVLAWGNSLGDFFGNRAMADQGQANTALTACFAGPLFNMLLSLALGFSSYFATNRVSYEHVKLTPEVTLGCVFLIIHTIVIAVVGWANKKHVPAGYYVFARAWYGLYLVLACIIGFLEHYGKL